MKVIEPRVSYADLERAPEDGRRYELYDGEVHVVPSPHPRHQDGSANLFGVVRSYARQHGGKALYSPIDIVFSDYDVLQPDIVFFRDTRRHLVHPDEPIRSAPDLVVEVLSPSTEKIDRGRKMQAFAKFGVPEYWIVDPYEKSLEVYRLSAGRYTLEQKAREGDTVRSATLAHLEFPAASVFVQ